MSPLNGFVARDESAAGNENLTSDNLTIYPNPVPYGEMLNVRLQGAGAQGFNLAVYDVTGKILIKKHYSQEEQFPVDVSAFPSGAYILTIRNGDLNFTKKFIVF